MEHLDLTEVLLIHPTVHRDSRGSFLELWHQTAYAAIGIPETFVQDNLSVSRGGVVRGLHYQYPRTQGKLVMALVGEVFDVAVDVRRGSPTFGRWTSCSLSADNRHQLFIPEGFAHGFAVTSPEAVVAYKCTAAYDPRCEVTVRYDDPGIGVAWPIRDPLVSAKDQAGLRLHDVEPELLPSFTP